MKSENLSIDAFIAYGVVKYTNQSIFITGKAGTGKSTLIEFLEKETGKKFLKLSYSGIAAQNIGGYTINSVFRIPIDIPTEPYKFSYKIKEMVDSIDAIIIDEISFVSKKMFDFLEKLLRFNLNSDKPFGGIQMILVGDCFQLPPVNTNEMFFENSYVKLNYFQNIVLNQVYRQNDTKFIEVLDKIRNGTISYIELINSSNNGSLYENLANLIIGDDINLINESDIYKSLHEVEQLELFNLGVKPISEEAISYTQLFGRNVGEALDEITKNTKSSANLFGKGFNLGERITIGCSSKGRVWSRMVKTIPEFCEWCDTIGEKLNNENIDVKNIFNFIAKPERISILPTGITPISIIWNDEIYFRETEFFINEISFFEYKIYLNIDKTKSNTISFSIKTESLQTDYELVLDSNKNARGYHYNKIKGNDLFFTYGRNESISIEEFFLKYPPIIRFSDSSKMYNDIFFEFKYDFKSYNTDSIQTNSWEGVNITNESQYNKTKTSKIIDSIQYYMINELKKDEDYKIIFDDDDKDEISDIVAIKYFEEDYSKVIVDLYHCKYSQKHDSGARLKDLYEVCGQAQRSFHWKHRIENLIHHINSRESQRINKNKPTRFEKGGAEELYLFKRIVESGFSKVIVNINIIQPGVSKSKITNEQLKLLGATEMLLKNTGNNFNVVLSE